MALGQPLQLASRRGMAGEAHWCCLVARALVVIPAKAGIQVQTPNGFPL